MKEDGPRTKDLAVPADKISQASLQKKYWINLPSKEDCKTNKLQLPYDGEI